MIPRMLRLLFVAGCLWLSVAHAETRAWLDRDRIELGETATLNIETDQAGVQPPDYDALLPDFVVSGHSSRRSDQRVNGRRRAQVLFAVALEPRREGVMTVPALRVGGETTAPLAMTVTPASTAPARAGAVAFIESEADSQEPYVQQSLGYVLRLYYATPLVSGQLDQPAPEGASIQRIGSDLQYTRDIGGRRYTVVERRFQIVPERSGTLTIPGARFEGRGVGGFFDDLLGNGTRELRANGAPRILQVQPMPDGAPQPWLPLHGLTLRYLDAPQSARAGEAATVVVEAVGDGAVATQMPELQLQGMDGAQVFAEPAQVDETFDNGRLRSRVVRKFSIVPSHAGALRIPGPRIAWWDVRAGVARTASLPDLLLQVSTGTGGAKPTVPTGAATSGDSGQPSVIGGRGWPWIALAFALLWLGTLAWALRRRGSWPATRSAPTAAGIGDAPSGGRPSQRRLAQALQAGDLGDVAAILCAMPSPPAADLDALLARLDDPAQREAIAALQRARWGDGDAAVARTALREAFKPGPAWKPEAPRAPDWLPPLYPRE